MSNTTRASSEQHRNQKRSHSKAGARAPQPPFGKLLLVRHAESEWNVLGKWTGRTDVHLTDKGKREARQLGEIIRDVELHHAFHSEQVRTLETLLGILETSGKAKAPRTSSGQLNERDYGDYTGLNKWEVLEQLGEDVFTRIRRSWDHPIPNGETLQMVYERAIPFYLDHILPKLQAGENVLVVSHGNTLRALIKYLERISDDGISLVEMTFGEILVYEVDAAGLMHSKAVRKIITKPPHA